nr:unnamed protein product [Callosobruchus analis]
MPWAPNKEQVFVPNFAEVMASLMRVHVPGVVGKHMVQKKKVGVLISGSGTNLQALIDATQDPTQHIGAEIVLVISNKPDVEGLRRAERANIPTKEAMDEGAIIIQKAVPIEINDTVEILTERIKTEAEHKAFPEALRLVANDKVRLGDDNRFCVTLEGGGAITLSLNLFQRILRNKFFLTHLTHLHAEVILLFLISTVSQISANEAAFCGL